MVSTRVGYDTIVWFFHYRRTNTLATCHKNFILRNYMPKVYIYGDEWYPVYSAVDDGNTVSNFTFDVDQETLDRWSEAAKIFSKAQSEMSQLVWERERYLELRYEEIRRRRKEIEDEELYDPITGRLRGNVGI